MRDFLGNELEVGDNVAMLPTIQDDIPEGEIMSMGETVRIGCLSWGIYDCPPHLLIKVPLTS